MTNQTAGQDPLNWTLVSEDTVRVFGFIFKLILNPTLGLAGMCFNAINMAVFFRMGLRDGVTQNFFILSMSDGVFSGVAFVNSVAYILQQTVNTREGEFLDLQFQRAYWASFFAVPFPQNVSLVTTVVIAVVRCCCVAMPLRVKSLLTARRQLVAILVFSSTAIAVLLYVFTPMKTVYLTNPQTNRQYAVLVGYRWATYTAFAAVTFYSSFITVIVCVVILSVSLNRSARFRQGSSSSGGIHKPDSDRTRDMRVVRTVVFVSVVLIICLTPHLMFSLLKVFIAGFAPTGRYRNENQVYLMVSESFLLLNANVNIFIYFLNNTRYRNTLMALVGKKQILSY